jgi:hypothetical protein
VITAGRFWVFTEDRAWRMSPKMISETRPAIRINVIRASPYSVIVVIDGS